MSWLARLKKNECTPESDTTKLTTPGFVGFVGSLPEPFQKSGGDPSPANDPAPRLDPDRWAWPHSSAMNEQELDTLMARKALFQQRGASPQDAERLADKLVGRDRGDDDRRLCLECRHLRGNGPYRCGNPRVADLHPDLPPEWVLLFQRCHGYGARLPPYPRCVIVHPVQPTPAFVRHDQRLSAKM